MNQPTNRLYLKYDHYNLDPDRFTPQILNRKDCRINNSLSPEKVSSSRYLLNCPIVDPYSFIEVFYVCCHSLGDGCIIDNFILSVFFYYWPRILVEFFFIAMFIFVWAENV